MYDDFLFIIFGASGDLAKKKLFPSMFELYKLGRFRADSKIIGYARSEIVDFRNRIRNSIFEKTEQLDDFLNLIEYYNGQYDKYEDLEQILATNKKLWKNDKILKIFYMATPPSILDDILNNTKKLLSNLGDGGKLHLVVTEKPFGNNHESSLELDKLFSLLFCKENIYRVDHYLGKTMIQKIIDFRINPLIKSVFSSQYIRCIEIIINETKGLENRAGYFDQSGIIRDIVQNHMMQMLSLFMAKLTTVENKYYTVLSSKIEFLKSLKIKDIILCQYESDGILLSYKDEVCKQIKTENISLTPTYALINLSSSMNEWKHIDIIINAGKALDRDEVCINLYLNSYNCENIISYCIQPDSKISFKINMNSIGNNALICSSQIIEKPILDGYVQIFDDILSKEFKYSVSQSEITESWKIFEPILNLNVQSFYIRGHRPKEEKEFYFSILSK